MCCDNDQMMDVLVIGAGPVGLACALEAKRAGLRAVVLDKGALVNSIVGYPARMEFFSTPDLIEIGGHPFPVQGYKPTREEGIEYYRGVTAREGLDVRLYEAVTELRGGQGDFTVVTSRGEHRALSLRAAAGRRDRRAQLGREGGAGLLPSRRAGDDGGTECDAVGDGQVLDQARPREPHQGRLYSRFLQYDGRGGARGRDPAAHT